MPKSKRLPILAAVILASIMIVQIISVAAEPVSFALGSYKVNFDLNTADGYKVVIAKPIYSAMEKGTSSMLKTIHIVKQPGS